jgi:hypothetical protein
MKCRCGERATEHKYGTAWCKDCMLASEFRSTKFAERFNLSELKSGHGKKDKYSR